MTFLPDDWTSLAQAIVAGLLTYAAIIIAVRMVGLRSFAKMSSHDFAATVATGSILASGALSYDRPIAVPITAVVLIFAVQYLISKLRAYSKSVQGVLDNNPVFLVRNGTVFPDNLKAAKVSENELRAKLREANVLAMDEVHAVIFETTGDVSVLHGTADKLIDPYLLEDVADLPRDAGSTDGD